MQEKFFLEPILPDPGNFEVVNKAPKNGEDYWSGAPSIFQDREENIWLTYRVRNPDERGKEIRIARSNNGYDFQDVKTISKSELGAKSLERSSLVQDPKTGHYKLYLSPDPDYEAADPQALGWHIVKLEDVSDPASFDPDTARVVLSPEGVGSENGPVKDPYVLVLGWKFYMFYTAKDGGGERPHLASSVDGENWRKHKGSNPILDRKGWHDFHTRISCVLPWKQGFIVYYEGANRLWYQPMYNIQIGVATSLDLKEFVDVSLEAPLLNSPTPPETASDSKSNYKTMRYMDYAIMKDKVLFYYEAVNEEGAFDLRVTEKKLIDRKKDTTG